MSDLGTDRNEVAREIEAVRALERASQIRRIVTHFMGWAVALFMTIVAACCLLVMWSRPTPQDRLVVALIHDDDSYEAPRPVEDLTRSERDILFRHTVIEYVRFREDYSWESVNANYKRVSVMSTPEERDRYQTVMRDGKNPDNPAVAYGTGTGASKADVTAIEVYTDPNSPNAVDARFVVTVEVPNQPPMTIRKFARMTWMLASDRISSGVMQLYDPAGIAFSHYRSLPDPEAK